MLVKAAEFARKISVSEARVSQYKSAGRLVMAGRLVDVDASIARIAATDSRRLDVQAMLAVAASVETRAPTGAVMAGDSSRVTREHYQAEMARLDYQERAGELVSAEAVRLAQFNKARRVRDALESMRVRLAAQLAAETDIRRVDALLAVAVRAICTEIAADHTTH